jgi:hypothetical protein
MVLARLQKQIGEADFFLREMHEQEPRIIGDKEPFDYYLSAFLNAAMSVRDGFQIRQDRPRNTAVKAWREQWERALSADEKNLYDFMHKDRVDQVHYHGSSRDVGQEGVPFPIGTLHVDGGMVTISGPPGMDPAVAYRPTYSFIIGGADSRVTGACAAYLALLQRMVADFAAANPWLFGAPAPASFQHERKLPSATFLHLRRCGRRPGIGQR